MRMMRFASTRMKSLHYGYGTACTANQHPRHALLTHYYSTHRPRISSSERRWRLCDRT